MKTLVIAEKPAAAREIAEALGVRKKIDGALVSSEYVITWAIGHLVTLREPHEYKEEWKRWSLNTLPMLPEKYQLKVIEDVKKQFEIVQKFLTSNEFYRVINACDAGREGELIFDNIYRLSGSTIPPFRLWTSAALTSDAIQREFKNLKPASEFNGLRIAARARAVADWTIGMNATRAITLAFQRENKEKNQKPNVFSVGRVQTPTLQFLISRELELLNFVSKPFWVIGATLQTEKGEIFNARYEYQVDNSFTHQIFSQDKAKKIIGDCENKKAKIMKVESKDGNTPPPLLFDLTDLQKEANKRFALSADKTLELAQSLYEKHKCITYPRTEYRHLTEDNRKTLEGVLKALQGSYEDKYINQVRNCLQKPNRRVFDNSKVGDHHALIPTSTTPKGLSESEEKLYNLIVNRFLAVFAPDFRFESSIIASLCADHLFVSRGKIVKENGWKDIEKDIKEEENKNCEDERLPSLKVGDQVEIQKLTLKEDKTKPPPRYTDATLLAAMQNPSSKTKIKEEKELLKECGLGTPATRASILKRLETTNYIEREKKNIKPTEKAFMLMGMLQKYNQHFLSNPVLTAKWENHLQEIEKDVEKSKEFLEKLNMITIDIVNCIKNNKEFNS